MSEVDLSGYKAGQVIVAMSRVQFMDLWRDMLNGSARGRWPEGREAETKKERQEELRIRTLAMIKWEWPVEFEQLLGDEDWSRLELYMGAGGVLRFRVGKSSARQLADARQLHRKYYGR